VAGILARRPWPEMMEKEALLAAMANSVRTNKVIRNGGV
jgi:hypothetical protein